MFKGFPKPKKVKCPKKEKEKKKEETKYTLAFHAKGKNDTQLKCQNYDGAKQAASPRILLCCGWDIHYDE